jgi:hypothetical protein
VPSALHPGIGSDISIPFLQQQQQQQEAGQPRGPAVLTSGTLRLDVGPMAAAARAPLAANNQKLGLLAALLRVCRTMRACPRTVHPTQQAALTQPDWSACCLLSWGCQVDDAAPD